MAHARALALSRLPGPRSRHAQVVFGTIIRFFEPNETVHNIPSSGASWLWGGSRGDLELHLAPTKFVVHPVKLSAARYIDAVLKWHRLSEQWY